MKRKTLKKTTVKRVLIIEALFCYMALLALISHVRGPARLEATGDMLVTASSFTDDQGNPALDGTLRFQLDQSGDFVSYAAWIPLTDAEGISVSFSVDCPEACAGGKLHVDLYNLEAGYDSDEQEDVLQLQTGAREFSLMLDPGEQHPEGAMLRIFTLDPAQYEVRNLSVVRARTLPKVAPSMLIVLTAGLLALVVTIVLRVRMDFREEPERETMRQDEGNLAVAPSTAPDVSTTAEILITHEDVVNCYRYLLGREPENEEVILQNLRAGYSLDDLRRDIIQSREFQNRLNTMRSRIYTR